MKTKDNKVCVRFDDDKIKRMDSLIEKDIFDNRSSFIRRATAKYLDELEPKVLA